MGADIRSSRVNDGLCGKSESLVQLLFFRPRAEKECCDGSDEPEGVCPNICEIVGNEYREHIAAETRVRKTVCDHRVSSYHPNFSHTLRAPKLELHTSHSPTKSGSASRNPL